MVSTESDGDIADRFNALEIGEFQASDISYCSQEKFVLRLSDTLLVWQIDPKGYYSDYDLQFNRILNGRIKVDSFGPGKILRWRARRESALLDETLRTFGQTPDRFPISGETFVHFELTFERGKLDVVARDFFLTVLFKTNS